MDKITITVKDLDCVSDGFHTMEELYEHRVALFTALLRAFPKKSWWSFFHDDGSRFDGWVIAGIKLKSGMITYHLPSKDIVPRLRGIKELEKAPKWDGHTPKDVLDRLDGSFCEIK